MRLYLSTYLASLRRRVPHLADERGDVPGWVLVTLMTAGLVVAIWLIAGPALINVFETAMRRVLEGI
ncbi:hypothetical protein [Georgenia sp. H159]|uniref:hypothetical protein n=1 Tax=Georgenia sp. H159 TaxID=3076115 RepID=UPI002D795E48|nr:hypothetical protein [Georgenia sp. H159]